MGAFDPPRRPAFFSGPSLLLGLVVVLFCIFGIRLWYLQIYKNDFYRNRAQDNRTRHSTLYSPRGVIRDRDGILLAENIPAYALALIREDCPDIPKTLNQISAWSGISLEELQENFDAGRKRVKHFEEQILVPNIPFELVAVVEAHLQEWPGLTIVVRPRRSYIYGETFAHIIGYVARANEEELNNDPSLQLGDDVGKQGVEYVLERRLRGQKGLEEYEVDASGRVLSTKTVSPSVMGEDITLSISLSLQQAAIKAMDGKVGAVVVMDADTGQILAQVSQPSFDPNAFVMGISHADWNALLEDPLHPLQNRPLQSAYPPGSVFKLVLAGAALEQNIVTPATTFFCSGRHKLGRREFRCWKRGGHGKVDLEKSLRESCDVYYYIVGEKLGVETIHQYAVQCGFGVRTGVELPHERSGLIPDSAWKMRRFGEKWQGGETLNFSIGQGYTLTTPLQIARFVAALANGGDLLRPTLLLDCGPEKIAELPMSEKTRVLILEAMVATVEDERGTARLIRREGVRIGGKTGTAQVVKLMDRYEKKKTNEIPYKYRDHAWLASFAEKDGRRFVVVVMLEHGGHGGADAGPIAGHIYDAVFGFEQKE